MSEQKTVTVRIPVAVDYSGKWHAMSSWDQEDPRKALDQCRKSLAGFPLHILITAEVPIPQPVTVPGKVEE